MLISVTSKGSHKACKSIEALGCMALVLQINGANCNEQESQQLAGVKELGSFGENKFQATVTFRYRCKAHKGVPFLNKPFYYCPLLTARLLVAHVLNALAQSVTCRACLNSGKCPRNLARVTRRFPPPRHVWPARLVTCYVILCTHIKNIFDSVLSTVFHATLMCTFDHNYVFLYMHVSF